jgi:serine/threonine-protein kinase HipA
MSVPDRLAVLLDGAIVASLEPLAKSHLQRLRYLEGWLGHPYAYPVSLALPLASATYEGLPVRNWLRGLLPDNEARLQEIETSYQVSRDDPYAVLANVGEDCVGAVQFAAPARAAEIASGHVESGVQWLDEPTLELLLREVASRSGSDRRAVRTGQFSLPGALGKVALVWDSDARRWGQPTGQWPSTHILKPPMPGVPFHNENEHFCLQLAASVGLESAKSTIVRFGAQGAIAVERYDREVRVDRLGRLHQEDMTQALGLDPQLKYGAEGSAGIREIVQLLRDYAHPVDVERFVHYIAYVWITAATDAHPRNYSILITSGENAELAPLYDVASALGLPRRGGRKTPLRLAMAIGGMTDLRDIDHEAWSREFARSRLPRRLLPQLAEMAVNVTSAAGSVAQRLIDEEGLDAAYLRRLAKDIAARAESCRTVLLRAQK